MKRIYSAQDTLMLAHLHNILRSHGIECLVRNEHLAAAAGEIPPIECWLELWILDDTRMNEASALLRRALAPIRAVEKPWQCAGCDEEIGGQFTQCWKCGANHPSIRE
ncbi:MAG: DUF2007 domain-containing protein [Deltaproteobacteria bacterium]|nr:DUF2007 domain-containing protein [Deltaproteobacteria bacterium]